MTKSEKQQITQSQVEYPYAQVRFYYDYVNGNKRNYTYKNPHSDLKVGDVVNVKTGMFSIFHERVFVMELLKETGYRGKLKKIGKIISRIDHV